MKTGFLHLKDNVILRSDKNRSVIYFKNTHHKERILSSVGRNRSFDVISPDIATAFYLMDGTRNFSTIISFVEEYFKLNQTQIENLEKELISSFEIYYSASENPWPHRKAQMDLSTILPNLKEISDFDLSANYLYYPHSFLLIPHMQCGVDCIYCYADKSHPHEPLSMEMWESIIYDLAFKYKAQDISVSGGDFFLYPNWKDFVSLLAYYNYYPEIPTKTPLSYEDQVFLHKLGFGSYQISIDTFDDNLLSFSLNIKNPEKYRSDIIKSIENAERIGLDISINSVQTRLTYRNLYTTMQQLAIFSNIYRIGIDAIADSLYKTNISSIMLQESDLDEFEHQLKLIELLFKGREIVLSLNRNPKWNGKDYSQSEIDYLNRNQCNGGRTGIVILPDGSVTCCEELYWNKTYLLGNVKKQPLDAILLSEKRWKLIHPQQSDLTNDNPCKACEEKNFAKCNFERGKCWRDALKIYRKEHFPDPRCPHWKKNISTEANNRIHHKLVKYTRDYDHILIQNVKEK